LGGTSAGKLADMRSLIGDIQFTRDCAATYLQTSPDALLIRRALWTASCIVHRRVFTTGKGHLEFVSQLPGAYDDLTPKRFFDECYGKRSAIVHGNAERPDVSECATLTRFVLDVLDFYAQTDD
jgi:hypothetical protein